MSYYPKRVTCVEHFGVDTGGRLYDEVLASRGLSSDDRMRLADEILETHGVEGWTYELDSDRYLTYCNTGDMYALTLTYCSDEDRYRIESYEDARNRCEAEGKVWP